MGDYLLRLLQRTPIRLPQQAGFPTVPMTSSQLLSAGNTERKFERTVCGVYHGTPTNSAIARRVVRTNV
jgi:hypothetical protein